MQRHGDQSSFESKQQGVLHAEQTEATLRPSGGEIKESTTVV